MSLRAISLLIRTAGFRLALWYSGIFIISSLALFLFAYILLGSSIQQKDQEMIEAKLNDYALQAQHGDIAALLHEAKLERDSNEDTGFFVRIVRPDSTTLFLTVPHSWQEVSRTEIEARARSLHPDSWQQWSTSATRATLQVTSRMLDGGYALQIGRGSEEREKLLERFRRIFAAITLPMILLGFAGGFLLAFRALNPVRALTQTVRRGVDTGKLDARAPRSHTGDELDELALLFNTLLEKIEQLLAGMRAALDNVAHDLRTPLTRLRGVVETTLQDNAAGTDTLRESLMDCAEESERLVTLVNTLMDISEAETGVLRLDLKPVDLAALLGQVVELYQYVAEEKGLTIITTVAGPLSVHADAGRLRQVVANLLDNAVKYTPTGGRIEISAARQGDEVTVAVADSGVGVPSHDLPHIFERLYRADASRSQRGLGLGLSLVKAVVEAHHGTVTVNSHPGRGAVFTVHMPTSQPAAS
ncbi:MAG: ATP-binding protein [Desulfobacteraceae bacterium]|nr:ATP-binding protein [Desulfobacteraceae bacterium]